MLKLIFRSCNTKGFTYVTYVWFKGERGLPGDGGSINIRLEKGQKGEPGFPGENGFRGERGKFIK